MHNNLTKNNNVNSAKFPWAMTSTQFTLSLSVLFVIFYNTAFFKALFATTPITDIKTMLFTVSIALVLGTITALILSIVMIPRLAKPLIIFILFSAASASYFMNTYGIVIHRTMIQNTFETDTQEATALLSTTWAMYILFLGVIPSTIVAFIRIKFGGFKQELKQKLIIWAVSIASIALLIMCFSADYASFFRNNKDIRQKANPANFIYATVTYALHSNKTIVVKPIGEDAKLEVSASRTKPTLFILVVGETARADHFSINGYHKPTTPRLAQQNIINYTNVFSCGTETAVSVPCMFSNLGRNDYSDKKAKSQEGLLDVLKHAGISVLWRDNNSGCKGTCNRVDYDNMSKLDIAELCNEHECFDDILLHELNSRIEPMQGDKVIVLHQKGSHGPEYYRRYPASMEVFKPVCKNNKLQECTSEEINNAFDNTIHYTDHFLNNTIEWLKNKNSTHNTAMLYLSDHGESLGEKNLYLHGMPYVIAPKEQKHIPFFFWFSDDFAHENKIDRECLLNKTKEEYSHDNLFHTTLGLLNVHTALYRPELDMLSSCYKKAE